MSLVFYYAPMSTALVTAAVLAELDVPHERIELDIDAGDTRNAAFLQLNPNGRVPTIVHDGTVIWESAAITIYLGETFGVNSGLYPGPRHVRGEAMKWIVWTNTVLAEAAGRLAAALPAVADGAVQEGSADLANAGLGNDHDQTIARADIHAQLGILDAALGDLPFLLGDYTLADTHMFVFVSWACMLGADVSQFKAIPGWMERCGSRPAFVQLLGD